MFTYVSTAEIANFDLNSLYVSCQVSIANYSMHYENSFPKIQSSGINFPALTGTKTELAVPQTNAVFQT